MSCPVMSHWGLHKKTSTSKFFLHDQDFLSGPFSYWITNIFKNPRIVP